jgi:tRNA-specific 2-thiouridylase
MTLFPLGHMIKDEVREQAQRMGLPNWDKADSEDICFVPQGNYAEVIEKVVGEDKIPQSGPIIDLQGNQVGMHNGLHHYTIGQRRGVGVSTGERVYVVDIKPESRTLVVGSSESLLAQGLRALNCRFRDQNSLIGMKDVIAQIRYRNRGVEAQLISRGEVAEVYFTKPQSAVTLGQAVVFYQDNEVIGGGWIEESITGESL